MYEYSNYLMHHGIEGQKWGVRNGPPYPLRLSKLSSEERQTMSRKDKALYNYKRRQEENLAKRFDKAIAKGAKYSRKAAESAVKSVKKQVDSGADVAYVNFTKDKRVSKYMKKGLANQEKLELLKNEMETVMNYSYDDMVREKKALGKEITKSALLTIGTLPIAALTGVYTQFYPDANAVKSEYRKKVSKTQDTEKESKPDAASNSYERINASTSGRGNSGYSITTKRQELDLARTKLRSAISSGNQKDIDKYDSMVYELELDIDTDDYTPRYKELTDELDSRN